MFENVHIALKALLTAEQYDALEFAESANTACDSDDSDSAAAEQPSTLYIKLKRPPSARKNLFMHVCREQSAYTAQMFILQPTTGEKKPLTCVSDVHFGTLELMQHHMPTLKSFIDESLVTIPHQ